MIKAYIYASDSSETELTIYARTAAEAKEVIGLVNSEWDESYEFKRVSTNQKIMKYPKGLTPDEVMERQRELIYDKAFKRLLR